MNNPNRRQNPTVYEETRSNGMYRVEWAGASLFSLQFHAPRARIFRHFTFVAGTQESPPVDAFRARIALHAQRGY